MVIQPWISRREWQAPHADRDEGTATRFACVAGMSLQGFPGAIFEVTYRHRD